MKCQKKAKIICYFFMFSVFDDQDGHAFPRTWSWRREWRRAASQRRLGRGRFRGRRSGGWRRSWGRGRQAAPMSPVLEGVLVQPPAGAAHPRPHGRETVQVLLLREEVQAAVACATTHPSTHWWVDGKSLGFIEFIQKNAKKAMAHFILYFRGETALSYM